MQLPGRFAFGAAVFAFDGGGGRRGGGDRLAFVFVAGELHAASEFHAARAPLLLLVGCFLPVRFQFGRAVPASECLFGVAARRRGFFFLVVLVQVVGAVAGEKIFAPRAFAQVYVEACLAIETLVADQALVGVLVHDDGVVAVQFFLAVFAVDRLLLHVTLQQALTPERLVAGIALRIKVISLGVRDSLAAETAHKCATFICAGC